MLEAARALFSERGLAVPMREIARRAEVGPATLYRRFPTKQALIDAAFADEMRACRGIVRDGCADPDPWRGLSAVVRDITELNAVNQGFTVGQMIVEALGGEGNVVIVSGNPGQTDVVNRIAGLEQAIAGTNITILDEQPANWSKDRALTVTQDLLTRYPDIDAIFALDDPMALGALEAVKAADRLEGVRIYGVGGFREACDAIANGEMGGTALQLSYLIGVYSVRAAYDVHVGRVVPGTIIAPTAPITPENVASFESQCW